VNLDCAPAHDGLVDKDAKQPLPTGIIQPSQPAPGEPAESLCGVLARPLPLGLRFARVRFSEPLRQRLRLRL
jgi:hypothetical protein